MITVKPRRLEKGDTIGIVAPASSFNPDNFRSGVSMLRKMGYDVKYEDEIFNRGWYTPDHDMERAEQINRMFADRKVRAIMCASGGSGSIDIIPYLDKKAIKANPKIFVGYSDISILLLYLHRIGRMAVFHGPVVSDEIFDGMNHVTLDYLLRTITQTTPLGPVMFPRLVAIKPGKASGILVGGNMSLIMKSIDTRYEMPTTNKIIFMEDVNEKSRSIREYFSRMIEIGMFDKARGLLLGKMVKCYTDRKRFQKMIADVFRDHDFPILFGFPSGHKNRRNAPQVTLPFGVSVTMDAGSKQLVIDEPAVR